MVKWAVDLGIIAVSVRVVTVRGVVERSQERAEYALLIARMPGSQHDYLRV